MLTKSLRACSTALLLFSAACGGIAPSVGLPGTDPTPGTPPQTTTPGLGWQTFAAEHIALWYHALAITRLGVRPDQAVPLYQTRYYDDIAAARRGIVSTLDRRAAEFQRTFAEDPAFGALQFLPLYFESAEALFAAVTAWDRAGGDPRNAGSQEAAAAIQFLASQFPRAAQRRVVVDFVDAVRDEQRAFFGTYWQQQLVRLNNLGVNFRSEWRELQPTLGRFLEYAQLRDVSLFLVPALGGEGRSITSGVQHPRMAVGAFQAATDVVYAAIHEILYAVVSDVIKDSLAPADIRTIGEETLSARAAVRGGALLLERVAPARAPGYRQFYLQQAGRSGTSTAAFEQAFPIPAGLERALENEIRTGLSGF